MTGDEFKKLDLLERLKVQTISFDISTAYSLYENAKTQNEESLFFDAFVCAIGKDRISDKKNIYSQFFNEVNAIAYIKKQGQSEGGKKSKRTRNKPKRNKDQINLLTRSNNE